MKIRSLLLLSLLLAIIMVPRNLWGQGIIPQIMPQETPQVQPDSVTLLPFPSTRITEAFGNATTLINAALKKHLTPENVTAYTNEVDTLLSDVDMFLGDSTIVYIEGLGVRELNQITLRSQFYIKEIDALQDRLSDVTMGLESESKLLQTNTDRWRLTIDQEMIETAMETRIVRINRTIQLMDSAKHLLQDDLVLVLAEQDKLADLKTYLEDLVSSVREQKVILSESLFKRDSPGFFKDLSSLGHTNLFQIHVGKFKGSLESDWLLLKSGYIRKMVTTLLLTLALLAFAVWFKKNHARLINMKDSELSKLHLTFIQSPVVTILFLVALMIRLLIPDLPQTFYAFNLLIMMITMAILMIRIYGRVFRIWIMVLVIAASMTVLYELSYHPGILIRILLVGMCLAGIWLFNWIYVKKPFSGYLRNTLLTRFFRILVVVFMVLNFAAIIANLVGTFALAEFFTLIPLQIAILAIAIHVTTKLADTLIFLTLSTNYLQKVNVIREEFEVIYKKSLWLVDFILLFIFFSKALRILRVKDLFFDWGRGVLNDGMKLGAIDITLGNILIFVFVIWFSVFLTRMISHILEKDVFTRVTTSKGIPNTVVLLVRIALISGGFFLAAAASGMRLTNLSIVLGAFSVGIGFGLQNIFNNMVSGLILSFERPINVGDVVQVGELMGTVLNIGLRASRIKSFDGAEVIVPNGNLISNSLINWTLSDTNRRMDIRVGVAYGTDLELVLKLMEAAAGENQKVWKEPAPKALFLEFGDSSLNFRLLAWTQLDFRMEVESEVKIIISKKLKEAGIMIPFPQRDLHIRSDDTRPDAFIAGQRSKPEG